MQWIATTVATIIGIAYALSCRQISFALTWGRLCKARNRTARTERGKPSHRVQSDIGPLRTPPVHLQQMHCCRNAEFERLKSSTRRLPRHGLQQLKSQAICRNTSRKHQQRQMACALPGHRPRRAANGRPLHARTTATTSNLSGKP